MTAALTIDEIKKRLLSNAFAHLLKGLHETERELNFAVPHFYDGVELIIKTCLISTNWKFSVQKPGDAEWEKFCDGRAKTVGLSDAAKRLETLCNAPIPDEALIAFNKLRSDRNQLTHFYHPTMDSSRVRERIYKDLLLAWFHLRNLMKSREWEQVFASEYENIKKIETQLQDTRDYFKNIYVNVVSKAQSASLFSDCPSCGYTSLEPLTRDAYRDSVCRVCEYYELSHRAIKDGEDVVENAHCVVCGGENCVIGSGYGLRCKECNETFTHAVTCDYCGETFAGDTDEDAGSYQNGCNWCDGKIGYLMQKDD